MRVEEVCKITAKGQTTVPKAVRQALGLGYGGRIAFRVEDGAVTVHAVEDGADPVLGPFLDFLAGDLSARPGAIAGLTDALVARLDAAMDGVSVDPDALIEGEVAL